MFGPMTPNRPGFAIAYRAGGKLEAEVIRGRLESAGIPVLFDYESAGQVLGLTVDGLGEVRVMVPKERLKDAQLLLSKATVEDWDEPPTDEPDGEVG
jgi:hypothetical protein